MKTRLIVAIGIIIAVILMAAGLLSRKTAEEPREPVEKVQRAEPQKVDEKIAEQAPEEVEKIAEPPAEPAVEPIAEQAMPTPLESIECKAEGRAAIKKKMAGAPEGMVYVPGGEFVMGSPVGTGHPDENPAHRACVNGYYIDRYEVTNARFNKFVEATGYVTEAEGRPESSLGRTWRTPYGPDSSSEDNPNSPVVCVSWSDADAYARWAGKRLPTEAEWEKAARGTDSRTYPWGNDVSGEAMKMNIADKNSELSWRNSSVDDGFKEAAPVGSFPGGRSAYGVEDMAGNVWEWCQDWWGDEYYKSGQVMNPQGPQTGEVRVIRGGSWFYDAYGARTTHRSYRRPEASGAATGFRCVMNAAS
jgi:formylglycine-generating enzyme required for sulfatase activity